MQKFDRNGVIFRKIGIFIVTVMMILSSFSVFFYNSIKAEDIPLSTIYVDDDNTGGPWNGTISNPYRHIEDAIENASDYTTIIVASGFYQENLDITKPINLIGEDKNTTFIDGGNNSLNVIIIHSGSVNISGFTIQNSGKIGQYSGIDTAVNNDDCFIFDNIFTNNSYGVYIHSANNTISHNVMHGNVNDGIHTYAAPAYSADYNNFSNNLIFDNGNYGIYLYTSEWSTITNNVIFNNTYDGIHLFESNYNTISNNTIYNNSWSGIYLQDGATQSDNNSIVGNTVISNDNRGIAIITNENNIIYHNIIKDNPGSDAYDNGDNTWYNVSLQEGNYYSDYLDTDADGDGIVDTPHNISAGNNQDLYPLGYFLPIANFTYTPNASITTSDEIQFNSISYDPDGSIVQHSWNFWDGNTSNEQNPVHQYSTEGNHNITLTVTDNDGDTSSKQISIFVGGFQGNNSPIITMENPQNNSNVPTDISSINVTIEDPEGDLFYWSIETNPDVGSDENVSDSDGTKTCQISDLQPDTTYTWYVNTTDSGSGNWTNETYYFTTESEGSGPGGSYNVTIIGEVCLENGPGIPVEGATVYATVPDYNPNIILNSTQTDNMGLFNLSFNINSTIMEMHNANIQLFVTADGYSMPDNFHCDMGIGYIIYNMGCFVELHDSLPLEIVWNTTAFVNGTVLDLDTLEPIEEVIVFIEGPDYFENDTETDENGNFSVGTITGEPGDFEIIFEKNGYFTNGTIIEEEISEGDYIELGTIYLEEKPPSNAYIEGYVKCDGVGIEDVNLILFDPVHPFEGVKDFNDMPITDSTGYYNISTYSGNFYLVTLAKLIGDSVDSFPLGIGGYVNDVSLVNTIENSTTIKNINLTEADPDEISVVINQLSWNFSTVNLVRTISSNPKVLRMLADLDMDQVVSSEEALSIAESINSSFTQQGHFEEETLLTYIPFDSYSIDGASFRPIYSNVEITGLTGSAQSSEPIVLYANLTMNTSEDIYEAASVHSMKLGCFYQNPAFELNYTINTPSGNTVRNIRPEMISTDQLGSDTISIIPLQDPDWNDTQFYEMVYIAIGTANPFAEFNNAYFNKYNTTNSEGKIKYIITGVKFNTTQQGAYKVLGKLCSLDGIEIVEAATQINGVSGSNLVSIAFEGRDIYKSRVNGPYTVVYDLFYYRNSSYIWFDSINKTTANYDYTSFRQPDIYFTGAVTDSGLDEDDDGLYDYLVLGVEVDVGTPGYYEFMGRVCSRDFTLDDPVITSIRRSVNIIENGTQIINLSFNGGAINDKGANASIEYHLELNDDTNHRLDETQGITNKYYYTDFVQLGPENCVVFGTVKDAFGNPVGTEIRLWDEITMVENTTESNSTTGNYSINARTGIYSLEINAQNYDHYDELVVLSNNESCQRNITLLPNWDECNEVRSDVRGPAQFESGAAIHINVSVEDRFTHNNYPMNHSNCSLEIYKQYSQDDEDYGMEFLDKISNVTDDNGEYEFIINTNGYTNGDYEFIIYISNNSFGRGVARAHISEIQISALGLDLYADRYNYRPGSTGNGSYILTYLSNDSEIAEANYSWKVIKHTDHNDVTLSSGTFLNEGSGNGTFDFTIPSTASEGEWYDIRLVAEYQGNEVRSSWGFGITEGSVITNVEDYPLGTYPDYEFLVYNVTVNASSSGYYRINSGLRDGGNEISYNESEDTYCTANTDTVIQVYFDGEQIQSSMANEGQWNSWIGLYNAGERGEPLYNFDYTTTNTYNKDDFSSAGVCFNDTWSQYPVNGSNGYSSLLLNATIYATVAGEYNVGGNLYKRVQESNDWYDIGISWNNSETISVTDDGISGINKTNSSINVTVRFEGADIYNSNELGPYGIRFNLHRNTGSGDEWITNYEPDEELNYNYTDFEKPGALIEGITDYGSVDGDLVIGVNINVSEGYEGDYRINGNLYSSDWWWIANSWSSDVPLTNGTTEINLTFSGESIYSSSYDGPYKLNINLERTDVYEWLGDSEYDTDLHSYDDFSTPGAVFVGTSSDEGYDEDGDGFYNYVKIVVPVDIINTTSTYEVSGELYKETSTQREQIAWSHTEFTVSSTGVYNATLYFNGNQISNSGQEGYYGVNLWLRQLGQSGEIGHIDFTTDNSYLADDFDQPSVSFIENGSYPIDYNDGEYLNVDLKINSTESGTYRVRGNLHKVISQGGWDNWIWITGVEEQISFDASEEQEVTLQFDLAVIQASGYDGPYVLSFEIMNSDWEMLDNINEYQTQDVYLLSELGDMRAIYFTYDYDDYLQTGGEYLVVNVSLQVNESGTYSIGGDLHKQSSNERNFIAGSWNDIYLENDSDGGSNPQIIQLYFDSVEILSGIQDLSSSMQNTFQTTGSTFDIDVRIRRSNQWSDLDQLSVDSSNTYWTSNFSSGGVTINSVSDEGYNNSGDSKYDYLNVTANVTFSDTGNYEVWCDLSKDLSNSWERLGWTNEYVTVSSSNSTEIITLQFNGERISSAGVDGPYNIYMEIQNLDEGKRVARYDTTTSGQDYYSTNFTGSSIEINESAISDTGVDTDSDGDYNCISIDIPVISQEDSDTNIELRADLRKQQNYYDEWISWTNNWTSISSGNSTINIQFDSEIIRSSGLDGPYSLRLELWDRSSWKLLDSIENYETSTYSSDNFDAASASINTSNLSDWAYDSGSDDLYDYLGVNVSCNVDSSGDYWVRGDLYSDASGWQWIDNSETFASLDSTDNLATLQFDGMKIRNKGISGRYKVRIELMDDTRRLIDNYEPYTTSSYTATDFQTSGAEITDVYDRITDDGDLELNVTVNCSTSGYYWIGADLHKRSAWEWQWISWESNDGEDELIAVHEENVTIIFSGETIYNKGINGPYNIRIELRDQDTWTEQDFRESYTTSDYNATDFSTPTFSIVDPTDTEIDWGNDTDDTDSLHNYLELNLTINSTQSGTYWLHGDLEKRSGYNWNRITWKGQEITLDGTGEQEVKLKFDGERIRDSGYSGPYTVKVQIFDPINWTSLDSIEDYTTNTYTYTDFQTSTIIFIENDSYPTDQGVGTQGAYSSLAVTVAINSTQTGTYWLSGDLHKESGYTRQWISWEGEEISITEPGNHTFTLNFEGSQIRNKGINGPYQIRLELGSADGEWRQFDIMERYTTNSYNSTDFAGAGAELVDLTDASSDSIYNGNLRINVTVNSTSSGAYRIRGDLHRESGSTWQWVSYNSTKVNVNGAGEQNFSLIFEGSEIYEKALSNGVYHVRIELVQVGTENMVDSIDMYTTDIYSYTDFSRPCGSINGTDDLQNGNYLQVNVSIYSTQSKEYQVSGLLVNSSYQDVVWAENTTTVDGLEDVILLFDGSIINNSGLDPAKIYIELRTTSNWELIESNTASLDGTYSYDDFDSSVSIGEVLCTGLYDSDPGENDGNESLNFTANITFAEGTYQISAGLVDPNGTFICGKNLPSDTYETGIVTVNITFDGFKIYSKGLNGPYTVSYISVSTMDSGEIARETDVNTTDYYSYTQFEHYTDAEDGFIVGNYSSYALNWSGDSDYDYLVVNVTVNTSWQNVGDSDDFDIYADLYSSDGNTWITSESNNYDHTNPFSNGETTVKLYFEGDEIFDSETNGPYLLGYVRLGADIGGTWTLLDEASNVYTTSSYNYSDFESESINPFSATDVAAITMSNDPFSPNSDGTYDTTLVTVSATAGQTLYLNIYNSSNVIKKTGLSLNDQGSGTYTVTWNGKDDGNSVLSDGTYRIKVSDESTGDQANESDTTQTVVIDTTAPTGLNVVIENGDTYINTTSVNLTTISATDDSDKKMRFKNAGGSYTDWEDFESTRAWTLASTDGSRTVYFQAKDVAGNIATAVSDSITLDTTKPSTVNITITGKGDTPSTYSNDASVTLSINAEDATSGVEYMMIANEVTFSGRSWEEYDTSKEWTLTSANGVKTVYIKAKDRVGKVSDIYSDNITLDTTSPTSLDVSINSDQTYTNSTSVTLTLDASDTYNMKMRFNNSGGSWSSWESYSQSKSWTLTNGSGTKNVYFQVKDLAGNVATAVSDSITLDTTAPSISNVQSNSVTQSGATITWSTDESSTSIVQYGTTTNYGSYENDTTKLTSHSIALTGLSSGTTYHYRVKSRDTAGNLRTSIDKTFTTSSGADTTPPNAIAGLSATDKTNAESTITLTWNQSEAPDFAGYKIYRSTSTFSNVTASGVQLKTTITTRTTNTYDDTSATDGTTYYYAVTAKDTATPPNENQTVDDVAGVSVDDKAPTTTDNIPTGWQTSVFTIELTAIDNGDENNVNKTYYTTDGSDPTDANNTNRSEYDSPIPVGGENILGDGTWTIKYYSYDKNSTPNVESVHTKTLRVDTTDPSTTDNAPSGWQTSTPVYVTLNATDETSGVYATYYTKDGSAPTIASSQYSSAISFTSQGNRTLKYFTKDNATNTESIVTTYILIDTVKPTSEVTALSQYSSSPFTVSWTSSDASSDIANVTIQVKNGTGSWTDWLAGQNASGSTSYTAGSIGNTYYFRSKATDNATNVENDYDSDGDTYTTVVSAAMNATITSPSDNDYVKSVVNITGIASGPSFSKYWLNYSSDNGSSWTNIASSTSPISSGSLGLWNTTLLTEEEYTIRLYVLNSTGADNSYTINVTVDNTAPTITVGPSAGSVDENSAVISWTTNETTNATVEYGLNASYGDTGTESYDTCHSVTLIGLSADTTYHYRVISYDRAGNSVNSSDATFTTDEESGSPGGGGSPPVVDSGTVTITCDAGGPYAGTVGSSIEFSGSASGGTEPYTYSWDFDDDTTSSEQNPTHSYDSAGTYTVTLTATDDAGYSGTDTAEVTISEVSDDAAPVISSVDTSPLPATSEDTITISAKVTDDNSVESVTMYWSINEVTQSSKAMSASGNVYSTSIGPFATGDEIEFRIDAIDDAGQETSSGVHLIIIKNKVTLDELEDADETGVDGLNITCNPDFQNVTVKIQKKDASEITSESAYSVQSEEEIYSYLEIDVESDNGTLSDDDIDTITVKFKVTQEWIDENDINKSKVVLKRLHDGSWQNLTTQMIREDDTYVYYEAIVTGTSTFAVVGGKITQFDTTPDEQPDTGLPLFLIIGGVVGIIVLLVVFLFKAGFLYVEKGPEKNFKKQTIGKKKRK